MILIQKFKELWKKLKQGSSSCKLKLTFFSVKITQDRDLEYESAESSFKHAFQHYLEIGHNNTTEMLKFNTIANILAGQDIDPFDSPETKM